LRGRPQREVGAVPAGGQPGPRRRHPAGVHDLRPRSGPRLGPRRGDHPVLRRHPRDLFPYVLMKPVLILAAIGGGMTGVFVNVLFDTGLIAPAAPGSIIAVFGVAARDSYVGIALAVAAAAAVSFALSTLFLRIGKQEDGD